jgi:hypothetical protein
MADRNIATCLLVPVEVIPFVWQYFLSNKVNTWWADIFQEKSSVSQLTRTVRTTDEYIHPHIAMQRAMASAVFPGQSQYVGWMDYERPEDLSPPIFLFQHRPVDRSDSLCCSIIKPPTETTSPLR